MMGKMFCWFLMLFLLQGGNLVFFGVIGCCFSVFWSGVWDEEFICIYFWEDLLSSERILLTYWMLPSKYVVLKLSQVVY